MPLDSSGKWTGKLLIDNAIDHLDERGAEFYARPLEWLHQGAQTLRTVVDPDTGFVIGETLGCWIDPVTGFMLAKPIELPGSGVTISDYTYQAPNSTPQRFAMAPVGDTHATFWLRQNDASSNSRNWWIATKRQWGLNEPFYAYWEIGFGIGATSGVWRFSFGQNWQIVMSWPVNSRVGYVAVYYYDTFPATQWYEVARMRLTDATQFFQQEWRLWCLPLPFGQVRFEFNKSLSLLSIPEWAQTSYLAQSALTETEFSSFYHVMDHSVLVCQIPPDRGDGSHPYLSVTVLPSASGDVAEYVVVKNDIMKFQLDSQTWGVGAFTYGVQQWQLDNSFVSPLCRLTYKATQLPQPKIRWATMGFNDPVLNNGAVVSQAVDSNGQLISSPIITPYDQFRFVTHISMANPSAWSPVIWESGVHVPPTFKSETGSPTDYSQELHEFQLQRHDRRGSSELSLYLIQQEASRSPNNIANLRGRLGLPVQLQYVVTSPIVTSPSSVTSPYVFWGTIEESHYNDALVPSIDLRVRDTSIEVGISQVDRYFDFTYLHPLTAIWKALILAGVPLAKITFYPQLQQGNTTQQQATAQGRFITRYPISATGAVLYTPDPAYLPPLDSTGNEVIPALILEPSGAGSSSRWSPEIRTPWDAFVDEVMQAYFSDYDLRVLGNGNYQFLFHEPFLIYDAASATTIPNPNIKVTRDFYTTKADANLYGGGRYHARGHEEGIIELTIADQFANHVEIWFVDQLNRIQYVAITDPRWNDPTYENYFHGRIVPFVDNDPRIATVAAAVAKSRRIFDIVSKLPKQVTFTSDWQPDLEVGMFVRLLQPGENPAVSTSGKVYRLVGMDTDTNAPDNEATQYSLERDTG